MLRQVTYNRHTHGHKHRRGTTDCADQLCDKVTYLQPEPEKIPVLRFWTTHAKELNHLQLVAWPVIYLLHLAHLEIPGSAIVFNTFQPLNVQAALSRTAQEDQLCPGLDSVGWTIPLSHWGRQWRLKHPQCERSRVTSTVSCSLGGLHHVY